MNKLDPKAVWLFFISFFLQWLIFIILASFLLSSIDNLLVILILVFPILCFVWAKLTVHFYRYELTDAGFRKEYGIITKKYVTIPYDRIQNVDIYRTLFARMFGLSSLHIQTAGSSAVVAGRSMVGVGAEGQLPGISKEVAEQLRDELINRATKLKNQGV